MVQWVTYWPGKNLTYLENETFWILTTKHLPPSDSGNWSTKWFSLEIRLKGPFWVEQGKEFTFIIYNLGIITFRSPTLLSMEIKYRTCLFWKIFFLIFPDLVLWVVKGKKRTVMKVCAMGSKLKFLFSHPNSLPGSWKSAGSKDWKNSTGFLGPWDLTLSEGAWKLDSLYDLCSSFTTPCSPILSLRAIILQLSGFAYSTSCMQRPGAGIFWERISKRWQCLNNSDRGKKISSTYSFQEY